MRFPICALVLFFLVSEVRATAQKSDYLILDGDKYALHTNPLESFFEKYPDRRPKIQVMSPASWRGYTAIFKISSGFLVVKDLRVLSGRKTLFQDHYKEVSALDSVFPAVKERSLTWYTGLLVLPHGKLNEYVHMGYASVFEKYRVLFIRQGKVTADRVFTGEEYDEYRKLQFAQFQKSERFKKIKADLEKKEGAGEMNLDGFIYSVDVQFPQETILDYKDFKPNAAASVPR